MEWRPTQHPVETLAEWGAPAVFAAAAGWCAAMITHAPVAAMVAAAPAYLAGLTAMRRVEAGNRPLPLKNFEAAAFEYESDELLLDDPLTQAEPSDRVSQLFVRPEQSPGALVARIADYLGDRSAQGLASADPVSGEQSIPDASAALYTALANIRASLR